MNYNPLTFLKNMKNGFLPALKKDWQETSNLAKTGLLSVLIYGSTLVPKTGYSQDSLNNKDSVVVDTTQVVDSLSNDSTAVYQDSLNTDSTKVATQDSLEKKIEEGIIEFNKDFYFDTFDSALVYKSVDSTSVYEPEVFNPNKEEELSHSSNHDTVQNVPYKGPSDEEMKKDSKKIVSQPKYGDDIIISSLFNNDLLNSISLDSSMKPRASREGDKINTYILSYNGVRANLELDRENRGSYEISFPLIYEEGSSIKKERVIVSIEDYDGDSNIDDFKITRKTDDRLGKVYDAEKFNESYWEIMDPVLTVFVRDYQESYLPKAKMDEKNYQFHVIPEETIDELESLYNGAVDYIRDRPN